MAGAPLVAASLGMDPAMKYVGGGSLERAWGQGRCLGPMSAPSLQSRPPTTSTSACTGPSARRCARSSRSSCGPSLTRRGTAARGGSSAWSCGPSFTSASIGAGTQTTSGRRSGSSSRTCSCGEGVIPDDTADRCTSYPPGILLGPSPSTPSLSSSRKVLPDAEGDRRLSRKLYVSTDISIDEALGRDRRRRPALRASLALVSRPPG